MPCVLAGDEGTLFLIRYLYVIDQSGAPLSPEVIAWSRGGGLIYETDGDARRLA